MKPLKLIIILLLFGLPGTVMSQNKEYYFEITNPANIPSVLESKGKVTLVFSNPTLTNMFKNYTIDAFRRGFPTLDRPFLNTIYIIKCDVALLDEIDRAYSSYFGRHEEISVFQDLTYTPVDFNGNSIGAIYNQDYLDVLGARQAWDISRGDGVILGIAETVNVAQEDMVGKAINVVGGNPGPNNNFHGTQVAIVAAANTDNSNSGTPVGLAAIGFNAAIRSGSAGYSDMVTLADAGARVINMSWGTCNNRPLNEQTGQDVMDAMWERGVIMVAAAGNGNGSCSSLGPTAYHYPAALNHVIAVTGVGHRFPANDPVQGNRLDIFVNTDRPATPVNLQSGTFNDRVDISAPGYDIATAANLASNGYTYTGGTSVSAPMVTGTIALMFSVNTCLFPDEIESILKLTAVKNDQLPLNTPYAGQLGAGRLDAFAAVDMAKDMELPTGNVEVHDRIIDRWDFNLRTAPYNITMTNNTVSNDATLDFTARNSIEIVSGDYTPASGDTGFIDLKINAVSTACNTVSTPSARMMAGSETKRNNPVKNAKLYPNPNQGSFTVLLDNVQSGTISIAVFDLLGKSVYTTSTEKSSLDMDIPNLRDGIYFVKLSSADYTQTLKFIKN